MIELSFNRPINEILCLGAHADDIEIGALGILSTLVTQYPDARFRFVVFTGNSDRATEAATSLKSLCGDRGTLHMADFGDGFLPYASPEESKRFARTSISGSEPDIVFTPREEDRHQDHSFVARLGQQLLRDHLVLEYEISKYDGDLGRPQIFLPLSEEEVARKLEHLNNHFVSQQHNAWYSDEAFKSLLRIRGIECNAAGGYAEAFHVSKLKLNMKEPSR